MHRQNADMRAVRLRNCNTCIRNQFDLIFLNFKNLFFYFSTAPATAVASPTSATEPVLLLGDDATNTTQLSTKKNCIYLFISMELHKKSLQFHWSASAWMFSVELPRQRNEFHTISHCCAWNHQELSCNKPKES